MAWLYLYLLFVTIRVLPQALMVNQPLRITCTVPKRAENRLLVIAVEGYWSSEYELDGERAPQVFQKVYERVPCGVEVVSCVVKEETGRTTRVALPIHVGGCKD